MPSVVGLLLHALSQSFYGGLLHGGIFRASFCTDIFSALPRWDFFPCVFCRINFSTLFCGGFLGAVFDRSFSSAPPSSGLARVVFRIGFSVRSFGAAFHLSCFVWAFYLRSIIGVFFRALFHGCFSCVHFSVENFRWLNCSNFLPTLLCLGFFRDLSYRCLFHGDFRKEILV